MKRKTSYIICGAAAAALIAVFLLAADISEPKDRLSVSVKPAAVRSTPTVTAVTVQTTKTTSAGTAEAVQKNTEAVTEAVTTALIRDLNAADAASLMRVNGIGETLAAEIVAYREAHGNFERRSQLMEVPGIGETLMSQIMTEFEIDGELPETTASVTQSAPVIAETTATTEKALPAPKNLNEVSREALLEIPEMPEQLADRILLLRGQIKEFHTVYELCMLEGITGQYVTEHICPYLYIENDTYLNAKKTESTEGH